MDRKIFSAIQYSSDKIKTHRQPVVHIKTKEALSCSVDRQTVLDHVYSTGDIHGELLWVFAVTHENVVRIRSVKQTNIPVKCPVTLRFTS